MRARYVIEIIVPLKEGQTHETFKESVMDGLADAAYWFPLSDEQVEARIISSENIEVGL